MPILLPCSDEAFSQGDLLEPGLLYVTAGDKQPHGKRYPYALVLSRDCITVREGLIVVAPVKEVGQEPTFGGKKPEDVLIEDVLEYLAELREGAMSPDRFYLGHLPGEKRRLRALLDEIGTVAVPVEAAERAAWVKERRRAKLHPDFVRALPVRMFAAIGRVGFDDQQWLADRDLWMVCMAAENSRRIAQQAASAAEVGIGKKEFGPEEKEKAKEGREESLRKAQEDLAKVNKAAAPYEAERKRREEAGRAITGAAAVSPGDSAAPAAASSPG